MTYNEKMTMNIGIVALLFCLLLSMTVPMFVSSNADYNVAFADVGDTYTLTATVEPETAYQEVVWTLEIDKDKTSSVVYLAIKNNNPYDYISLDIDGLTCTLTVLKYNKAVGIKVTVYFLLTCTSVFDSTKTATCSIKLG